MPPRATTSLDGWSNGREATWCCSSKTIRPAPAPTWNSFLFEDPQADRRTWQSSEQVEKGHGRLERRQITPSPDLNDYMRRAWGGAGQVFRAERDRSSRDKHSRAVVFCSTTLSPQRCTPQRLAP